MKRCREKMEEPDEMRAGPARLSLSVASKFQVNEKNARHQANAFGCQANANKLYSLSSIDTMPGDLLSTSGN